MRSWLRTLGYLELIGGVLCIVGSMRGSHPAPYNYHLSAKTLNVLAGSFSMLAGILLLMRERSGLWLSLAVQLAQVVSFSGAFRLVFMTGLKFVVIFASTGLGFDLGGGGWAILISEPTDGALKAIGIEGHISFGIMAKPLETSIWALGINVVAALFAYHLWRVIKTREPADPFAPAAHSTAGTRASAA